MRGSLDDGSGRRGRRRRRGLLDLPKQEEEEFNALCAAVALFVANSNLATLLIKSDTLQVHLKIPKRDTHKNRTRGRGVI